LGSNKKRGLNKCLLLAVLQNLAHKQESPRICVSVGHLVQVCLIENLQISKSKNKS
jgi:hypothetical protein